MLARAPWSPVVVEEPKPKRLTRARRQLLRDRIADLLRTGDPTPFSFEGACRHGLRSGLVLNGWSWALADHQAELIVAAALAILGAKRPSWEQGQPEYTQPGVLPILRERCVHCRRPLPEGHWKFCSSVCGSAYRGARYQVAHREEIYAQRRARQAATR